MFHKKVFTIICLLIWLSFVAVGCKIKVDDATASSTLSSVTDIENGESIEIDNKQITCDYNNIEKDASFIEISLPTKEIASAYWEIENILVDTAFVKYDGAYIYAVLECFQTEMIQFPDLGELVIKYDVKRAETEILAVLQEGEYITKMVMCQDELFWITEDLDWRIYRYDINLNLLELFAQAEKNVEYSGAAVISADDSWFIYCEFKGKYDFNMHFYSVVSGKEVCFTQEQFTLNSPYWLPDVEENIALTILSKVSNAKVALYDLNTKEQMNEIELEDSYGYGFLDKNGYMMYSSDFSYNNIWLHHIESGKSDRIHSQGESVMLREFKDNFILYKQYSEQPKIEVYDTTKETITVYKIPDNLGIINVCEDYLVFNNGRYVKILQE